MPANLENPKYKRHLKNYLINPKFQIRYVLFMVLSSICLVVIYSTLTYHYFRENYTLLVDLSPMTIEAKAVLYAELHAFIMQIGTISILFIIGIGFLGIIVSHKTAGAVFHFNKIFKSILGGNLRARVNLRPGDDFQEEAKNFNLMMDKITKQD